MPTNHRRLLAAALASALAVVLAACATAPDPAPLVPPEAMHTEGVPTLDRAPLDAAQRYSRVAGHQFVAWHPRQRELLVSHRGEADRSTQLYRVATPMAAPERLTDGEDPVTSAQWEPREGRYLVFARGSGGDEAYQLYRLDPATRKAESITPAGQRHALSGWLKGSALLRPLALVSSVPLDRTAAGGRRSEVSTTLSLVDPLQPSSWRRIAELPGAGWTDFAVAPDEQRIAFTRYVSATVSEVWLLELASGEHRRLLPAPGDSRTATYRAAEWSADGRALVVFSDRDGEFHEPMRLALADGRLERIGPALGWDQSWGSASRDGRLLAMMANVDGREELRIVDAASGALRALPPQPQLSRGSLSRATFHEALHELAFVVSGAQGPAQVHSLDVASGRLSAWTRPIGTEGLDLAALPEQEIVRWKSFDGRTISGQLTMPPARFGGRRPVLMLVHGGPEGQSRQGWQGRWNYLVQELGIALLQPNVRGSTGYGKTFVSLDDGRKREDSVKDMAAAIDWVDTQPRLDPGRVLVVGGSYGGYMALAASTLLAERIAGASSSVGISNFVSFLENTESYRRDLRRAEYGDERDPAMRSFLQGISPLAHVQRITKPLMVAQGRNDPRVPWTESEQIVRSLQQRGTPVWYLLAGNEGHGFARRENADYQFAALIEFARRTLKP